MPTCWRDLNIIYVCCWTVHMVILCTEWAETTAADMLSILQTTVYLFLQATLIIMGCHFWLPGDTWLTATMSAHCCQQVTDWQWLIRVKTMHMYVRFGDWRSPCRTLCEWVRTLRTVSLMIMYAHKPNHVNLTRERDHKQVALQSANSSQQAPRGQWSKDVDFKPAAEFSLWGQRRLSDRDSERREKLFYGRWDPDWWSALMADNTRQERGWKEGGRERERLP